MNYTTKHLLGPKILAWSFYASSNRQLRIIKFNYFTKSDVDSLKFYISNFKVRINWLYNQFSILKICSSIWNWSFLYKPECWINNLQGVIGVLNHLIQRAKWEPLPLNFYHLDSRRSLSAIGFDRPFFLIDSGYFKTC